MKFQVMIDFYLTKRFVYAQEHGILGVLWPNRGQKGKIINNDTQCHFIDIDLF